MSRILFVLTSASKYLLGEPAHYDRDGSFLAYPYYVLSPHLAIDFASPAGPNPPLDPANVEVDEIATYVTIRRLRSYFSKNDDESQRFLNDPIPKSLLENTKALGPFRVERYVAIFYVGGHGPVLDLVTNETNIQLANEFYRSGKLVSAVCHGTAALVGVTGTDGKSIFNGKQIGKVKNIPFLLEDSVKSLGTYEKATKPFWPKVVHSGNLITGQNPPSSRPIAEEISKTLQDQLLGCNTHKKSEKLDLLITYE
ncbi:class I glutamine amidotransferase-like protein [Russula earlei]|uniref:Class I glutamine amidotransferase-like protein n=1 Tax=Russula earlei TaxID=71964 RepID=A0ACC0U8W3_9AGAM|nr:class I glutamine amidotransferase-like protein [Russula earlei]